MVTNIKKALNSYWGYDTFLPLQKEAMASVASGRDSLVVLPTGGGKSLCFQAPAVVRPGMALVVSPLLSLMKDQVDALRQCGVPAARIDSTLSPGEKDHVARLVRNEKLKILYVSPERLMMERFLSFLKKSRISFLAIDEAHCISMWGHDFRPEYRMLGQLKEIFPEVAVHAFTATATERVRRDIVEQLRLDNPEILVGSFDRPNLVYRVELRGNRLGQVRSVLDRHKGESGIVYCIRRADVDELTDDLLELGYNAAPYHAGMDPLERKNSQDDFIADRVQTIVATIAFGMGIDKSDVRYVVHTGMPKSLEHYQQETGRAGRDGLEAECSLFYSGKDYALWKYILDLEEMEPDLRRIALDKLSGMYNYCMSVRCRHRAILEYFGQNLDKANCAACDLCLGHLEQMEDSLTISQKILSCVIRLRESFGAVYTAQVLAGSRISRILQIGHDTLSTYGLLSDTPIREIRGWIDQLIGQGFLKKEGEMSVLKVTDTGWGAIRGEESPRLLRTAKKKKTKAPEKKKEWEGVDKDLFEALRELRLALSRKMGIPAYVVFNDATLRDMALKRPSSRETFLQVLGVGKKKEQYYGRFFLRAITGYCISHGLEMDVGVESAETIERRDSRRNRGTIAFSLFEQGCGIEEAAAALQRKPGTILRHLLKYIEQKGITNPAPWADERNLERVEQAVSYVGDARLKPIFGFLTGEMDYETIRICLACLKNR